MRRFLVTVNGERYEVAVEEIAGESEAAVSAAALLPPAARPAAPPASRPSAFDRPAEAPAAPRGVVGEGVVKAPLPGAILAVKVSVGETVRAGQVLVLLEAMKMENEIASPIDGHVRDVRVAPGDAVGLGDVLCVVEA